MSCRDWCPLCGSRFEADSPEELLQKVLDHLESKDGKPSYCEQHFVPWEQSLADDTFEKH